MRKIFAGALLTVAAISCGGSPTNSVVCNEPSQPAMRVTIVDRASQKLITKGASVMQMKTSDQTAPVVTTIAQGDTLALGGLAGTYNLTLSKTGYQVLQQNGIIVPAAAQCGEPQTTNVRAEMTAL